MSEISNYEAQKKKLQGLCDEHNFTFRFFKDRYPITLVITPINDVATQMDMLGNVEETGYCSQDSSMCWYFENSELKTKVSRTPTKIFWESCTCSVSWATMHPGNSSPRMTFVGAWWKSPGEATRRQRMPASFRFRTRPAVRAHC